MALTATVIREKGYVSLVRTGAITHQSSRQNWRRLGELLRQTQISRLLADCRKARVEMSIIEADDLAKELKQELELCEKIALITHEGDAPVMIHFKNVCACHAIDVELFTDPQHAEAWLCNRLNDTLRAPETRLSADDGKGHTAAE